MDCHYIGRFFFRKVTGQKNLGWESPATLKTVCYGCYLKNVAPDAWIVVFFNRFQTESFEE